MSKLFVVTSGKGGVGKSLGYLEYVSLADGNVIQIGPYTDSLFENNKEKIKQLIVKTNLGEEIFEVIEPPEELVLNIVRQENEEIASERRKPLCIMRKPAPKELLKIKTANGDMKVTKEHKFLVMRKGELKKVRADELMPKEDYLLTFNYPITIKNFENGSKEIARLLGYLIGDGYIEKRGNRHLIHIFSEDNAGKNLDNIKKTFKKVFGGYHILKDKRNNVCRISFMKSKQIEKIFLEYGVKPRTAALKEIPTKIFRLSNSLCAEFLSALFDCDGHACKRGAEIQYDTKSEILAFQIINLLRTKFGIESQLKEEYKKPAGSKKEKQKYFRITISGEDAYKFYVNIGFKIKFKQDRLKEKINHANYNTNIKLFPVGKLIRVIREDNNITGKKLADLLGCTKQMVYEYEWGFYALSRNSISKFLNVFRKLGISHNKLKFIENILNKGYSFRRVEGVEEVNYNYPYVYDFQVCDEGGHFVHGTGMVVSNTTSAVNLGAALNYLNQDVIVVDANLETPNVGLHLGAPIVPVTLNHVLSGKANIGEAIYEHASGTKILPSSLSLRDINKFGYNNFYDVAKKLKRISDYVIIDSPAGIGEDVSAIIEACDEVIIVTNPELPAVTDALKVSKIAKGLDKDIRGIIIARVKRAKSEMPSANIKEMIEAPIIGVVPEDISVQEALVMKDAVFHTHPRSKAARAYKEIASRLIGKSYVKHQEALEKANLFNRVLKAFGLR